MKRGLLLVFGLMLFVSVKANEYHTLTKETIINNRYDDVVTFIEKGVKFHVFLNGDFEFSNPHRNSRYHDYNGRRYRNNSIRVYRDYNGRIKRIGRNYIRYDYNGNVTKIGTIRLYYRRGLLRKVGRLKISYNSWGDPYFYGRVKHNSYYDDYDDFGIGIDIHLGDIFDYDHYFFYRRDFRNNYKQYKEDRNYYYYRAKPNAKIGKRNRIIKRRKSSVTTRKKNSYNRRKTAPETRSKIKRKVQKRTTDKKYENRRRS